MSKPGTDKTDTPAQGNSSDADSIEFNNEVLYSGDLEPAENGGEIPDLNFDTGMYNDTDSEAESDDVLDSDSDSDISDDSDDSNENWDHDRQDADQSAAVLRKDNEALRKRIEQLEAKAKSNNSTEQTDDDDSLDDIFSDSSEDLDLDLDLDADDGSADLDDSDDDLDDLELDELSDTEDISKAVSKLLKANKRRKQAAAQARNRAAFNRMLDNAAKEVGEDYRNDIVAELRKTLKADGYDKSNLPDAKAAKYIIIAAARKVALNKKPKAAATPKNKPTPQDKGSGGSKTPRRRSNLSLDEAVEEMVRKGEL